MLSILVAVSSFFCIAYFILVALLRHFAPSPATPTAESLTYLSASHSSSPGLPLTHVSSPASLELSVVVPAYNETSRLRSGLQNALEWLEERRKLLSTESQTSEAGWKKGSYEVVIVDDGSVDDTVEVALEIAKEHAKRVECAMEGEIRVVKTGKNLGKGGAVRHGMLYSRGHRILFADADGASHFPDLDKLLSTMDRVATFSPSPSSSASTPHSNGYASLSSKPSLSSQPSKEADEEHALVTGSRAHLVSTPSVVSRSPLRNFLMRSFHLYLYVLGVRTVRDTQCGFKLLSRATVRDVVDGLHVEGWIFDVELLLLAELTSPPTPIAEVPIRWNEVTGSKLSVMRDSVAMAVDLLVIRLCYGLGIWKVPRRGVKGIERRKED